MNFWSYLFTLCSISSGILPSVKKLSWFLKYCPILWYSLPFGASLNKIPWYLLITDMQQQQIFTKKCNHLEKWPSRAISLNSKIDRTYSFIIVIRSVPTIIQILNSGDFRVCLRCNQKHWQIGRIAWHHDHFKWNNKWKL